MLDFFEKKKKRKKKRGKKEKKKEKKKNIIGNIFSFQENHDFEILRYFNFNRISSFEPRE